MKITKIKKIRAIILPFVAFVSIFFLDTTEAHAWSCYPPHNIFVAAYEQGNFLDGFEIRHRATARMCGTRPIVSEHTDNLQSVFTAASQDLNKSVSTGVYQLSARCRADGCIATTLVQLSNSPSELVRYKSEWQAKEQEELRSVIIQELLYIATIAITTLAILWPWILVRIWPKLRRWLSLFLIIAILIQAPFALIWFFILANDLWQLTALISLIILGLSIFGEIIIIVRKNRFRNVPV